MSLLLLAACIPLAGDDTSTTDRPGRTGDTTTEESTSGSVVRFATTEVRFTSGEDEVPVATPAGGTFVRVDSCTDDTDDGRRVCDTWDGGYHLYEDGELILTPSTWDGDLAVVTWLVIE